TFLASEKGDSPSGRNHKKPLPQQRIFPPTPKNLVGPKAAKTKKRNHKKAPQKRGSCKAQPDIKSSE
ncbi:hypothetical protein, partial [Pseudomonas botevensis]|uniref:hypothetical protein n=1 Tax=Pseudomonas botevensis TaxID=2842352 RepID=UPI001C3D9B86